MENRDISYEPKSRSEYFVVFKFLKLFAIFLGSWFGIWMMAFYAFRRKGTAWLTAHQELLSNAILCLAIGAVLYYIYDKVKNKQVERVTFFYSRSVLKVVYKNYFLHFKSSATFPFEGLSSSTKEGTSFLHGSYVRVSIFSKGKRVAYIDAASSDWQRLPNFLRKIDERITEIKSGKAA